MDDNSKLAVDEYIREFLDYTRPIIEAEYRVRGYESVIPKREGAGEDHDVFVIMRRIQVIERGIKEGKERAMFDVMDRRLEPGHFYPPAEKEMAHELFQIWLRTLIARDKAILDDFGLLKLVDKGDLRTAKLIEDERELLLRALKFEMMRSHPAMKQIIRQEVVKLDPDFLVRLGQLLKKPGVQLEHVASEQRRLLLLQWAVPLEHKSKKLIPPLCYFSDPALAMYVEVVLKTLPISPGQIRKAWERLGLRKAKRMEVTHFERRNGRYIFTWTPE